MIGDAVRELWLRFIYWFKIRRMLLGCGIMSHWELEREGDSWDLPRDTDDGWSSNATTWVKHRGRRCRVVVSRLHLPRGRYGRRRSWYVKVWPANSTVGFQVWTGRELRSALH